MQYIIMGLLGYALLRVIRSIREAKRETRREEEMRKRSEEAAQMRAEFRRQQTESKRIVAEQIRQAKELAKHEEQLAKHEKRIADLEFRMNQAEVTIMNEQTRLDHYTAKLSALDKEIAKINFDLEYYQLAHEVDNANRALTTKARIEDKIFSLEEKVRASEMRIAKAQHTKEMAEKELCA